MKTILLISPYWKEDHRWMVSSVKLAELWQRLGYNVVVVCMGAKDGVEKVSASLTIYRKKDFFLPDPWNYGIAFGFTSLARRVMRETKPDLVVVNKILFWSSLSMIGLTMTGKKVILLTDTLVGITWWPRGWLPQVCAAIYAWTLGWLTMLCAQKIVFYHPQPESLLKKMGVWKKSTVIPTGIDPAPYGGGTRSGEKVTITYVGRLESVKGVEDFLAAAVSVKSRPGILARQNITIQVVGWSKPDHPLVKQYASDVSFTGLRSDIPQILRTADIFVLPSYSEGLSNALMEAMASGCACIASDVGGNAFLIQNGVSGFLFPAGDREALAAHLRRLIDDAAKRRALGEAARKRIEEQFSWNVVGVKYGQLFNEM